MNKEDWIAILKKKIPFNSPNGRRYSKCKSELEAERDRLYDKGLYNLASHFQELVNNSPSDSAFIPAIPLKHLEEQYVRY